MSLGRSVVAALRMPGVAWSFSVLGFRQRARGFGADELAVELTGKHFVVTGATSGLGFATAQALARRGATTWLLCRDAKRGEEARRQVAAGGGRAELVVVDLADLAAVRRAAASIASDRVDGLIHNAGALPHDRVVTVDGLELDFAVQLAAPHLLTRLLRPRMADARVVWVSSGGMYNERLTVDDLQWTARPYDGVKAYAQIKRAQIVVAEMWARTAPELHVYAMHPGWADTPGVSTALPGFYRTTRRFLRRPDQGADTIVWLAAVAAPPPSGFWFDRAPAALHIVPGTDERPGDRDRLWTELERITAAPPTA